MILGAQAAAVVIGMENAMRQYHAEKLDSEELASMTPEDRDVELRIREVRALERMAAASENTRRDVRISLF